MSKIKGFFKECFILIKSVPPLLLTLFVISIILMNIFANKSIDTGVSFIALDAGIVISWVAFLSMDILTKRFGPRAATIVSIFALLINLLFSLLFLAISFIPGVWSESFIDGSENIINNALDRTFRGSWYIIIGSSIAFAASAFINNFLNFLIGKLIKNNKSFTAFALRSYISTFIAQFSDNLIFALIVSHFFFGWSITQCLICALIGAIFELVSEIIFSPLGYKILRKMEDENRGHEYLDLYGVKE